MDKEQGIAITKLRQFSVCQVSDALAESCSVETSIRPIHAHSRICGPAFTVECAPGDNLTIHHALHLARPGDVLIVGGSANCEVALWGELMSISAQMRGLAGTIVDGPIRDPLEIQALGYPVFCREIRPCRATKDTYGRINVPVRIGAISIAPNDLVLADANGIIRIPHDGAHQAIQLASEIVRKEDEIKVQILSGRTIFDICNLEQNITVGPRQSANNK